jgi:hypothetical protein
VTELWQDQRMTPDDREQFQKILRAHADTIAICDACATTTRDLAAEVRRGGEPAHDALDTTIAEAERVLADLAAVRAEVERLLRSVG